MKGFIDCHCHISATEFDNDLEDVIENSKKAGLLALVAVAEHAGEFDKIIELSSRFPGFVWPSLGVHPVQDVPQRGATLQDLDAALPLIEKYKDHLLAIGEVGLDFTPRFVTNENQKDEQRQVLIRQIEIAKRLDLPLNVHSRSAGRPTINLLKEQGAKNVLLHAFDGKPSVALEGIKAGYFFSIPPSIIRSEQQKLVKQLPLEFMCLETDSPALGPEKQDIEDVITRAKETGVKAFISVTEEVKEFERVIQLSKSYPALVSPCLGIHPIQKWGSQDQHSVRLEDLEPALPFFQKYRDEIVAVGEIGLDYTPWYAPDAQHHEEQLRVFRKQVQIAKELDLPVNVHSRSAAAITIAILKEQGWDALR
nr:PREDICTED: putative deoxyribonuclease TATDN3 isoform X2 [Lepisosteus oculatus]